MDVHEARLCGYLQKVTIKTFYSLDSHDQFDMTCTFRAIVVDLTQPRYATRFEMQNVFAGKLCVKYQEKSQTYKTVRTDALRHTHWLRSNAIQSHLIHARCIHVAGSSEHIIRDLNDEINRKIRLKRHWELRIVELGGPDYGKSQPQVYESDDNVVHAGGYKYFGAAKNLPGVRELFEKPKETNEKKRTVDDLYANICPDYYGFRDDDVAELLEEEKRVEKAQRQEAIEEWEAQHGAEKYNTKASVP